MGKLKEKKNLQKQHRRNRLEDKLRQHDYYVETEELFDALTKFLNNISEACQAHVETMQALQSQTLAALARKTNALKCVGQ